MKYLNLKQAGLLFFLLSVANSDLFACSPGTSPYTIAQIASEVNATAAQVQNMITQSGCTDPLSAFNWYLTQQHLVESGIDTLSSTNAASTLLILNTLINNVGVVDVTQCSPKNTYPTETLSRTICDLYNRFQAKLASLT